MWHTFPMMIETERLLLRRWQASDSKPFHQLNSDPVVMEYFLKMLTLEESDAMIARMESHFEQNGFGLWAIEVKSTNEFIGFTGLMIPPFESHFTPCVEVGWRLAKSAWGKGFATEAAKASLEYGFKTLKLKEIVAMVVPGNFRSRAVMERLGMKRDEQGDFDHPRIPDGHPLKTHLLYRIRNAE